MESSKALPELNAGDKNQQPDENLHIMKILHDKTLSRKCHTSKIYWGLVIFYTALHIGAIYGLQLSFTTAKWTTLAWAFFLHSFGILGITFGAHRLFSHRSFKAKWPLRLLAALAQTVAGQKDIYHWARNHRLHHKFGETNADPSNAKRGFFFAHVGWLMCKMHPEVIRHGNMIDCSDLWADPIVFYQRKFYNSLYFIFNWALPALIPWFYWEKSYNVSFFVASVLRYVITLHSIWITNSYSHLWGSRPYDKNINPEENMLINVITFGEGSHNYHHTFPMDYKGAELDGLYFNLTTLVIDLFAWIGLAYDLRTMSKNVVRSRTLRTGDGSHPLAALD